ncbi:adaptin N terminal region-domain-containing protein [Dimargaris cristalligena]|uniref:AP complex subunit beta n=1 Tax=Dimargaris cristalligena TaxID=215637 RepID=A0A4P9ZLB2_9FUNG|nr:adaptin N terminal region-domain-containing protein [Dimargaris cristalligena]|eukprot:RKP33923.1 adaptin N terminal region-domain-containing protein [Dimargaris cristalligena]
MSSSVASQISSIGQVVRSHIVNVLRKGENFELRSELNSEYRDRRKEAVKRVIANMTVGKDVSGLFTDVLKNMHTDDLEIKKLIYLYLINYAKTKPELVILAINTFVKDTDDNNPLIRALAIRTMGCLRVSEIIDYLCDPLRKCLKDESPYVRKTAAICVAKLYDVAPAVTIENGFVEAVQDLLSDANPMVISNAVTALVEINDNSPNQDVFTMTPPLVNKLLAALNECTEWGQITILETVANYIPGSTREAEGVCERVVPRLQHVNGSVVLSAIKMEAQLSRKMTPPMVTLLSSAPEVQYVALRNINLILQKRPDILNREMRVFFCKYNDPLYVKYEKLDIMVRLCNDRNYDHLLAELKEYANEVDVDFVRKAIKAIGYCAIKIPVAAEKCINILLDLLATRVNYVVQETIVVIKDIFRKYPNKYEGTIPTLCKSLEVIDEPDTKASFIWIIGEYAPRIENADEILETFMDNFKYDDPAVQLQLITAVVKLFLHRPADCQDLVLRILKVATEECDCPDTRDRAYIYWRILSTDPQAANTIVLADKPTISVDDSTGLPDDLLNELLSELSTLAAVYHKPARMFVATGTKSAVLSASALASRSQSGAGSTSPNTGTADTGAGLATMSSPSPSSAPPPSSGQVDNEDLLIAL